MTKLVGNGICLKRWDDKLGEKIFLEEEGISFTYEEAAKYIGKIAVILKRRLNEYNEVVPIIIDNSSEFVIILLSLLAGGYIPYPLSPSCKTHELEIKLQGIANICFIVDSLGRSMVSKTEQPFLTVDDLFSAAKKADERIQVIPYSSKLICGTSGTTENPKKVVMQLDRIIQNALSHSRSLGLTSEDKIFSCLPFYHGLTLLTHLFSVIGLNASFVAGNSTYPPTISRIINAHGVSYTSFVPALLDVIVNNYDYEMFKNLKKVSVGSAPTSFSQLIKYRGFFKHQELFLTYGQTEAGPRITTLKINDVKEEKLKTIGTLISGTKAKINNPNQNGEGELWVKSQWQMLGYYNDPASSSQVLHNNWLKTGDLARIDNEGFISLCGRKKDVIISAGVNISPMEIEAVLNTIPWIAESIVLPMFDAKRGEAPQAFVVSTKKATEEDVISEIKEKLHHLKIPKKIVFVKNILKNNIGKPDRKAMSEVGKGADNLCG